MHDAKNRPRWRAVYAPANFHSDSKNPICPRGPPGRKSQDNKAFAPGIRLRRIGSPEEIRERSGRPRRLPCCVSDFITARWSSRRFVSRFIAPTTRLACTDPLAEQHRRVRRLRRPWNLIRESIRGVRIEARRNRISNERLSPFDEFFPHTRKS